MRSLLKTIAVLGVAMFVQPTAWAQCKPPSLRVVSKYTQPWLEYTTIKTLNPNLNTSMGEVRMGETVSGMNTRVEYNKTFSRSQGCFSIDGDVYLEMGSHDINIAKELKDKPCLLKEVTEHEQRHARLNEEMLNTLAQQVQLRINEVISAGVGYTPRQLGLYLESWLQDGLSKDVAILWERQNERQKALDTPEEYRRIAGVCPIEIHQMSKEVQALVR